MREAWRQRPLEARREALDRLIDPITLTEGGAHIDDRVKREPVGFHQAGPNGPPHAPHPRDRAHLTAPVRRVASRVGPAPATRAS